MDKLYLCNHKTIGIMFQEAISRYLQSSGHSKIQLKSVLFDMDGVLFDSMKNHTLAWYRALSSRKIPCERDEFYQYEGATAEWTINLIFERTYHRQATKQEIEELYTLKSKY